MSKAEWDDMVRRMNEPGRFTVAAFLRDLDTIPEGAMRVAPGSDAVVWNYLALPQSRK